MISRNRDYAVIEQPVVEIKELWEVKSKLSFDLDVHEGEEAMISLKQGLDNLREEIQSMKKGNS